MTTANRMAELTIAGGDVKVDIKGPEPQNPPLSSPARQNTAEFETVKQNIVSSITKSYPQFFNNQSIVTEMAPVFNNILEMIANARDIAEASLMNAADKKKAVLAGLALVFDMLPPLMKPTYALLSPIVFQGNLVDLIHGAMKATHIKNSIGQNCWLWMCNDESRRPIILRVGKNEDDM